MNLLKYSLLMTLVALVLAGCSHNTAKNTQEAPPATEVMVEEGTTDEATTGETTVTTSQAEESKISIMANDFSFSTTEIRVKKGSNLVLAVTNESGFHDLLIDELDVNTEMIAAGETVEVTIPTDTVGEYEYYCSVGNHREMGMKGTLIIEE